MATRGLSSGLVAANAAANVFALLFVRLAFLEGDVRLTTLGYDVTWNAEVWTGVGLLGSISGIREDTAIAANGIKLVLSGVDSEVVAISLSSGYRNRDATIWYGVIDDSGVLVASPIQIFKGRMDNMEVTDGKNPSVTLTLESNFATWSKPRIRRFNDADQKSEYPTDTAFEFITQTTTREIVWGRG